MNSVYFNLSSQRREKRKFDASLMLPARELHKQGVWSCRDRMNATSEVQASGVPPCWRYSPACLRSQPLHHPCPAPQLRIRLLSSPLSPSCPQAVLTVTSGSSCSPCPVLRGHRAPILLGSEMSSMSAESRTYVKRRRMEEVNVRAQKGPSLHLCTLDKHDTWLSEGGIPAIHNLLWLVAVSI